MVLTSNHLILKAFFLLLQALVMVAKSETQFFNTLYSFHEAQKGQTVKGLNQVKQYLMTLGYYSNKYNHGKLTDYYDDMLEFAVKTYQKYYHLQVTGKLDDNTIKQMMVPRCGIADINLKSMYKWSKRELTYTYNSSEQVLSIEQMRPIIARAFQRWTNVSSFTIREELNSFTRSDVVIGFHRRDHTDGDPFDGPLGILAHASLPEGGDCHFDADEIWSTTNHPTQFDVVIDFESIAMHEMGHLLGLVHSQDRDAIMYAPFTPGTIKRDLSQDDIDRIRALYNLTN